MILESILIIGFAILLDLKFGDPKSKFHPTAWIGSLIAKLTPAAKNQNGMVEKIEESVAQKWKYLNFLRQIQYLTRL